MRFIRELEWSTVVLYINIWATIIQTFQFSAGPDEFRLAKIHCTLRQYLLKELKSYVQELYCIITEMIINSQK